MSKLALARNTLIAAAVLTTAACDTPVSESRHADAGGVVILNAETGAVIAQVIGEGVAFAAPLNMTVGQALEIEVLFLDEDDPTNLDLAFHPHEDEGESLRVVVANEAIVEYHAHGDHGDLEALAAGQTTITFALWHGNHADFQSGPLTVIVQ